MPAASPCVPFGATDWTSSPTLRPKPPLVGSPRLMNSAKQAAMRSFTETAVISSFASRILVIVDEKSEISRI